MHDEPPRPTQVADGVPDGFDRVIARALAKDPERRYPSAGDLGRAALAAAEGRPVTESERTVARGAAAPAAGDATAVAAVNGRHDRPADSNGRTAATAVVPPREERTAQKPGETLPLGDRPRRRLPGRSAAAVAGLVALAAAAAAVAGLSLPGGGADPREQAGAPVDEGEVEALAREFATAYGDEDGAELGRLLTRDAERVVPGARQEGRTAVLRAYRRQFRDSDTRSFELRDLDVAGGSTGRASARFVATYGGEPDVTGSIVFGVLRERGTPRIAMISARQDPPAG
jgi:serine/threonine-protein kinase